MTVLWTVFVQHYCYPQCLEDLLELSLFDCCVCFCVNLWLVNETLEYETETRPRHLVFSPRRDRDITKIRLETVSRPRRLGLVYIPAPLYESWQHGGCKTARSRSHPRWHSGAQNDVTFLQTGVKILPYFWYRSVQMKLEEASMPNCWLCDLMLTYADANSFESPMPVPSSHLH